MSETSIRASLREVLEYSLREQAEVDSPRPHGRHPQGVAITVALDGLARSCAAPQITGGRRSRGRRPFASG